MQQKCRFLEISEILRAQFKVLYRVFGYYTCKQDTEERNWLKQFGKRGKGTQ